MSYSLLSPDEYPTFNSGVVRPFQCLGDGWSLVKDQYLLFVLLCLIIVFAVSCIPFTGIIWGAWMAGIYIGLLGKMRGEPMSFNAISKGFGFFSPAWLVGLLSGLPFALISIGTRLMSWRIDELEKHYPGATPIPSEVLTEEFTYFGILILAFATFHIITGLIFPFAYQLVVERHLSGWEATKLSSRAAQANLGGVLGLVLIEMILGTMGICLCCIGLVLVMPLTKAAWAIAYRQVFPAPPHADPIPPSMPPPPPAFGNPASPLGI